MANYTVSRPMYHVNRSVGNTCAKMCRQNRLTYEYKRQAMQDQVAVGPSAGCQGSVAVAESVAFSRGYMKEEQYKIFINASPRHMWQAGLLPWSVCGHTSARTSL